MKEMMMKPIKFLRRVRHVHEVFTNVEYFTFFNFRLALVTKSQSCSEKYPILNKYAIYFEKFVKTPVVEKMSDGKPFTIYLVGWERKRIFK